MTEEPERGAVGDAIGKDTIAGPSTVKAQSRMSPTDGKSERQDSAKRPRRTDAELAARGKRMFGLLNSTLSKAKEDNARRGSGEAVSPSQIDVGRTSTKAALQARKRAEIEAKAHEKLRAEEENIKQTNELSERLRKQLQSAYDLALEMHSTDLTIRLRKSQKRRLASFLVTPSHSAKDDAVLAEKVSVDRRILEADIACCLAPLPSRPTPDPPVYFLPKKIMPKQEDTLDDQEDRVDDGIDEADRAWEKEKDVMQDRLRDLKSDIASIRKDLIAIERGQRSESRKGESPMEQ